MNQQIDNFPATASTVEVEAAIERALSDYFGAQRRVVGLGRSPSKYRSSFPLEELEVRLEDGLELALIFKDLSPPALPESVRRAKPQFLVNPLREIEVYRKILAGQRFGTAVCYGIAVQPATDRYWLFLEKVPGRELYQVSEIDTWQQAARWLATLHARFFGQTDSLVGNSHLLRYDGDFYRQWMHRAVAFQRAAEFPPSSTDVRELQSLAQRYERVVERLLALDVTLIHGEFYASNVLVHRGGDTARVCPVDWEMAAIGPSLIDLAALTAGNWSQEQRRAMALAYYDEVRQAGLTTGTEELLESLDYCHLHLAVQWLGWSPHWTPPPEHRQNWLAEALRLSEKLRLVG